MKPSHRSVGSLDPVASATVAGLRYVNGSEPGIARRKSGHGFVYVDARGRRVADGRTLERIRRLVIPPAWTDVWICARPDGHLQATGVDRRGRKQYRYHPSYRETRDANKYGRMLAFAKALPRIRRRVRRDLRLPGLPKRKVLAAVVALLDRTCLRVGNETYAKENDSFGLTTLHDRHVDVSGARIRFHFQGKSGQYRETDLTDPRLARIVKQCRDVPGYDLFQYRNEAGDHHRVDSTDVNAYLREISGDEFTAKDFRTWHGTGHALAYLSQAGRARTKAQIRRNLLDAVKATALFLGNRPATCRKYYIHPAVTNGYAEGTIFGVVDTCGPASARRYEIAVRMLVDRYRAFDPSVKRALTAIHPERTAPRRRP